MRTALALVLAAAAAGLAQGMESEISDAALVEQQQFLEWLETQEVPPHNLSVALFESREFPGVKYRGAPPRPPAANARRCAHRIAC